MFMNYFLLLFTLGHGTNVPDRVVRVVLSNTVMFYSLLGHSVTLRNRRAGGEGDLLIQPRKIRVVGNTLSKKKIRPQLTHQEHCGRITLSKNVSSI